MNVLMITQKVDEADWLLGFAHGWVRALARRVQWLDVICLEGSASGLPANVRVMPLGSGRIVRLRNFHRYAMEAVPRADVIFSHLSPLYTLLAAPYALAWGKPIATWYTHRHVSNALRLAAALSARVLTASPESLQLRTAKAVVLGHGIDTEVFVSSTRSTFTESPKAEPLTSPPNPLSEAERGSAPPSTPQEEGEIILAVGRLSPIKNYETLIGAAAVLARRGRVVRVHIAGGEPAGGPAGYGESLRARARECGVAERVSFLGAVPHGEVAELYGQCTASVNLCPTGGLDKVVLESMACGRPVLACNRTYLPLFGADAPGLFFHEGDAEDLADKLATLLDAPAADRAALGERLRGTVAREHSLEALMDKMVRMFEEMERQIL